MVDDHILDKVLDKIKKKTIGIEKFDVTKILIDTNDKLHDDVTFKNMVISMTYAIKDDDNFYRQTFIEEALYDK